MNQREVVVAVGERLAPPRMPPREEKQVAQSLIPDIAWPTLAMVPILPVVLALLLYLGLTDKVSLWLLAPILGFVSYAHYILVHEGAHNNIVIRSRSFMWVNALAGRIGAFYLGAGWPLLQRTHILHHAHTNTDRDPDIYVKGSFPKLLKTWLTGCVTNQLPLILLKYVSPRTYVELRSILSVGEILESTLINLFTLGLLALSLATGKFAYWLALWYIPQCLAGLSLTIFFQWLPHYPFDHTERYLATRISLWPGAELLTFGVNMHLMHHLWPGVPFYNNGRLFRALYPVLIFERSRIEGLLTGTLAVAKTPGFGRSVQGNTLASTTPARL